MARFVIDGKSYPAVAIERLTLAHLLRLEAETAEMGRPMKWSELRAIAERVSALPPDEVENDDDFPWFMAMVLWAARLEAGENISFGDAVNFPLSALVVVPDPGDHQAGDAADPTPPRPGSGRGGANGTRNKKRKRT